MKDLQTLVRQTLSGLYSAEETEWLIAELEKIVQERGASSAPSQVLSEADNCFVCYANSIVESELDQSPLQILGETFSRFGLDEFYPVVHLLPFFPWDTDRGFSVCNYRQVAEENGTWEDVASLAQAVRLMFDFVANHASIENPLVQGSLVARHLSEDDVRYKHVAGFKDYVIAFSPEEAPTAEDLSVLARPRPAPVLTAYCVVENSDDSVEAVIGDTKDPKLNGRNVLGEGLVWTTFSRGKNEQGEDETCQVDLNFKNPKVFLETVQILLFYADRGARLIRLDAIGYLWKKIGSTSLHEAETHQLLVCLKAIMEQLLPDVLSVAEVNEPQDKVFGYLGSPGREESDIVYQFTHFPLAIHAVKTGTARYYRQWLATLSEVGGRQFITVLGSHDGMGMKPVRGILPEEEIESLLKILVEEHDGLPNYAVLPGGRKIVYEVCATPWDLVNNPNASESLELQLARYRAVVALGLQVRGLPAFYINGALGCTNYRPKEGLDENRTVNRQIFEAPVLWEKLSNESSLQAKVHALITELLAKRAEHSAFDPNAPVGIPLEFGELPVVGTVLPAKQADKTLVSLISVSDETISLTLPAVEQLTSTSLVDVLSGEQLEVEAEISLKPYQVRWLSFS